MPETPRAGVRGYLVSRPVRGTSYPQRVQHLVVRDFARRSGVGYRLSVTEYAMPGCYMMLEQLLGELPALEGIILFSAFCLPPDPGRRRHVIERVLAAGAVLYAALENVTVRTAADAADLSDMLSVAGVLSQTPFGGRYEKYGQPLFGDTAGRALLAALEPTSPPS